jgi:hypothetical protein
MSTSPVSETESLSHQFEIIASQSNAATQGTVGGGIASLAFLGFFLDIRVSICNVSVLESDIGAEDGR